MEPEYFLKVLSTLKQLGFDVEYFQDPKELISALVSSNNTIDYVFNLYYGTRSRNRKAVLPAICEVFKKPYLGADTYVYSLSKDKYLAKILMEKIGVPTPRFDIVKSVDDIDETSDGFPLPAILKPNNEGGSIGISDANMVFSRTKLKQVLLRLLKKYRQPIILEQFIEGRELTIPICGNDEISLCEVIEITVKGQSFGKRVYSSRLKYVEYRDIGFRKQDFLEDEQLEELIRCAKKLHKHLIPCDIIRYDLRFSDKNGPFFIEANPDVYIGSDHAFYYAFKINGYSYADMIRKVLETSFRRWDLDYEI
jgi:D-alanine-D-alanine ligase